MSTENRFFLEMISGCFAIFVVLPAIIFGYIGSSWQFTFWFTLPFILFIVWEVAWAAIATIHKRGN